MPKRIRQQNSVTVGHPDSINAYARELEERGESFYIEDMPEFSFDITDGGYGQPDHGPEHDALQGCRDRGVC